MPILHVGLSGGYGCINERHAPRQKSLKFAARASAVENQKPEKNERDERADLGNREYVLDNFADAQAARIDPGEENDGKYRQQILAVQADIVWTQRPNQNCHGPNVPIFQIQSRRAKTTEPSRR